MNDKFLYCASVNLLLMKDEKALLLCRRNTGWKDGMYGLVAGHVDGNETMAEAMVREAKEESGIDLLPEDLRVVHVQHRISVDREYIDFHLVASKWSGEPTNMEPDKCDELSWHPLDALPENTIPYIRLVFENVQKAIPFSDYREPRL